MRRLFAGAVALLLITQFGCGVIQKPSWNKPWGKGAWIPAAACGLAGAGIGVWIQDERTGTSRLTITDPDSGQTTIITEEDDPEYWKGAVIGAPVGAVVCGILGHIFLDPSQPPPPPPPPPSPMGEELLPGGVPVKAKKRIVLRGVYFDFDRADIRPDSAPVLDEAAQILTAMRDEIEQVVIEGYTDSIGSEEYNKALSVRRAEAVFRYLVNRGVPPELMRIEGFGESHPVADNDTEEGRAQNRRVELRVIHVKMAPAPAGVEGMPPAQEGEPAGEGSQPGSSGAGGEEESP